MPIPLFYDLKDDSINGKECEVIRENGSIKKILIAGEELPRKKEQNKMSGYKNELEKKNKFYFDFNKTKIPFDTKQNLQHIEKIDNFNLLLNKFAYFDNDKFLFFKTHKGKITHKIETDFSYFNFDEFSEDYEKKLKKLQLRTEKLSLKLDWRLIVGLGNPSVYETSITLHHIHGIPYIPGSAVKGITRNYYIQQNFEKTKCEWEQINVFEKVLENFDFEKSIEMSFENFKKEFSTKERTADNNLYIYFYENSNIKKKEKESIEKFQCFFGTQNKKGEIIFFDAFTKSKPLIDIDIMNPHYGPYYSGDKPPADSLNPVPIHFLTVSGCDFIFFIGTQRGKTCLQEIKKILNNALKEHGIGAKTAVGYGYFKN